MFVSIDTLKSHLAMYIARAQGAISSEAHSALHAFAAFVEGQQAEADAIALLQSRGYSVTPPPSQA